MTAQRPGRPADDDATFAPGERALLEESVRPVVSRSRGALLTLTLVILAFAIGLVRPWDWLATTNGASGAPADGRTGSGSGDAGTAGGNGGAGATPALIPSQSPAPGSDAAAALTCAYPQSWRSATLQDWAGRRAHVWTAVDAVTASGPLDPGIPFQPVVGDRFTALGWCAPVIGPDRPPLDARGTLFRIDGGTATPEPYQRLQPDGPNALGELWAPAGAATWAPGRYLIEVATPAGTWARWIGLELRDGPAVAATPGPGASGAPSASPQPFTSPGGAALP